MTDWPAVATNDDGIRPAGKTDECFYCQRKIGQPHGPECVIVTKRVKIRYEIELDIDVPHFWHAEDVEFQRNESSWCADNAIYEIAALTSEKNPNGCLCPHLSCTFIEVVDDAPTRKIRDIAA